MSATKQTSASASATTAPAEDTLEIKVKTRKPRRVVDKASVDNDFDSLCKFIVDEIERLRDTAATKSGKPPTRSGIKFLRSVNKRVKILRKDTTRAFKIKPKTKRSKNSHSGFMKPVKVSDELAEFAGWEKGAMKSRVDATRFVCKYVADNKLQEEKDRRNIVPDAALQKLLRFDPKTAEHPLTYYRIQTYIQCHFPESKKNREAREAREKLESAAPAQVSVPATA